MTDKKDSKWFEFYEITKNLPPSPLLVKALNFVTNKKSALDLGAGALRDTRFLSKEFKNVTAVDNEPLMAQAVKDQGDSNIHAVTSTFEGFKFPTNEYDLVNAQWSLPFSSPQTFDAMWSNLKGSLKKGGIFTGQFFGKEDEWNMTGTKMTFQTKKQVEALLGGMEIIQLEEEEKDGVTANGTPKHWHVIHVIARKK